MYENIAFWQHCRVLFGFVLTVSVNLLLSTTRVSELRAIMNRQIIHYKITFTGPENEAEIRYLAMETISYHNYLYFVRKLISIFPVLKDHPFSVNWKDREGDIVRICSDDELTIAMDEMKSDPVKKIFIIVKQQGNDSMLHSGIVCDGCDHPIKGFRYKCLVCTDYELCSDCERSRTHADHPMIRIPKPLIPESPYGQQFTKDMPKISQNLERLFQQTGDEGNRSSNQKNPADNKRRFKLCNNGAHNLIANLLVEKLIKHNMETSIVPGKSQQEIHSSQAEPSSSTDLNEPQDFNMLTTGLKSLNIDVNSGGNRRDGPNEQDEPVHSTSGGQRGLVTIINQPAANMFPSTTAEANTSPEEVTIESNPIPLSQIDAAPVPADPTPALQAQPSPPISAASVFPTPTATAPVPVPNVSIPSYNTTSPTPTAPAPVLLSNVSTPSYITAAPATTAPAPVPLSRLIASAPAQDSMNTASLDYSNNIPVYMIPQPVEDDGSLDNSWSFVGNEQTDASIISSPGSIASIESTESAPVSTNQPTDLPPAQINEQTDSSVTGSASSASIESTESTTSSISRPTDSPPVQKIGDYEECIMMLHTLGFEKKEWLNLVVESKKGDIKEVLKFLSPIKKLTTNLHI